MGYELTLPLKKGSIEIEFDTVEELEEALAALDVRRIERAIASAGRRRPAAAKGAAKKAAKAPKKGAKKASKKGRKGAKKASGRAGTA